MASRELSSSNSRALGIVLSSKLQTHFWRQSRAFWHRSCLLSLAACSREADRPEGPACLVFVQQVECHTANSDPHAVVWKKRPRSVQSSSRRQGEMNHSAIDMREFGDVNRYGPTAARPFPETKKRLDT